jgi:multiple sugar transport system permease protein
MKGSSMKRLSPGRILAWTFLAVFLLATIFPFYWMIRTALTPAGDLYNDSSSLLPHQPTLINFARVLGLTTEAEARAAGGSGAQLDFGRYLLNSVIYCGLIAGVQTLLCSMAGYAFARLRFPGRDLAFTLLVSALMVPPIFTLLPNFVLVKQLGWVNTMAGMVAPTILMTPFAVFFLRQFFLGISREVEEAALVEGASKVRVFFRLILPMSTAPIATLAILTYITLWNDYFWPLMVSYTDRSRVLTVALGVFKSQTPQTGPDWSGLMAATLVAALPMLILFMAFARKIVNSIGFSGIK